MHHKQRERAQPQIADTKELNKPMTVSSRLLAEWRRRLKFTQTSKRKVKTALENHRKSIQYSQPIFSFSNNKQTRQIKILTIYLRTFNISLHTMCLLDASDEAIRV